MLRWIKFIRAASVGHLRGTFISGIVLLVPIALTYLIVVFLFDLVDGVLRPAMMWLLERFGVHWDIPGPGVLAAALLIYLAGILLAHRLGRAIVEGARERLLRIPFIGTVYSANRQLIESFSGTSTTGFKRVVMARFPRDSTWSLGFLTGLTDAEGVERLAMVYVPTAPLPNSGFVVMMPFEDVLDTDLTVPQAMQLIFSGGIISPRSVKASPIDVTEIERVMAREVKPEGPLVGRVKRGLLATITRAGKSTRLSMERVRNSSAHIIRKAHETGIASEAVSRDAVVGTMNALEESRRYDALHVRDTVTGVICGVRDATGVTEGIILHAVEGAIRGAEGVGNPEQTIGAAAQGAVRAVPSLDVDLEIAISEVAQGTTEGLIAIGVRIAGGASAATSGVVLGAADVGEDPQHAVTIVSREILVHTAKIDFADLNAVTKAVVQGAREGAASISMDANRMAKAAEAGALQAAEVIDESAADKIRRAIAG